ncbi:MAG: hypothetical protein LBJ84_00230 [Oscillospiraceae bacterium]|jgi:hypothetical protein|nr:hypothetical protein [Oscillospiraceae bacterium]
MADLSPAMPVTQCKICRKPFQGAGGKICSGCLDKIERDLTVVRDYLDNDARDRTIQGIVDSTGVPRRIVMHLLRDGRISVDDPSGGTLRCGLCGKPIATGKFCEECKNKFVEKIDSLSPPLDVGKKQGVRLPPVLPPVRISKMHIERGARKNDE